MTNKELFIETMKKRTLQLAVDTIDFCNEMKKSKASDVVQYQVIKSSTPVGANYRASCKARSQAEFFSKISIVIEEADESEYWFTLIKEAKLHLDIKRNDYLINEANEINKIMTKARDTLYEKKNTI